MRGTVNPFPHGVVGSTPTLPTIKRGRYMSKESIFQKYYKKLTYEGLLKSIFLSLSIASFVLAIILLAFWFVGIKRYWLSAGIGVGIFAALIPSLYFLFFRPNAKAIAQRLDSLGLEERLLTMNELQNDESYIAMRQREDAKQALAKIDSKNVKIVLSKTLLVLLIVSFVCVGSMTTVSALANNGVIPGGNEIIKDVVDPENYYAVRYICKVYHKDMINIGIWDDEDVGGMIEGADEQLVAAGESSEAVFALADPDWGFVEWSDGSEDPYRFEDVVFVDGSVFEEGMVWDVNSDTFDEETVAEFGESAKFAYDFGSGIGYIKTADGKITIYISAYFTPYGEGKGDEAGNPTDDMSENGQEADAPIEGNPEGEGKDGDGEGKNDPDKKGEGDGAGKNDGKDNNNIIDGNTDYKTRLEEYIELAKQYQANGEDVPDYIKDFIQRYYNLL